MGAGKQLEIDFEKKAAKLCALTGNYEVLEKKIKVLEMDETPAFGLETVIKIGINGIVKCK